MSEEILDPGVDEEIELGTTVDADDTDDTETDSAVSDDDQDAASKDDVEEESEDPVHQPDKDAIIRNLQSVKDKKAAELEKLQSRIEELERNNRTREQAAPAVPPEKARADQLTAMMKSDPKYAATYSMLSNKLAAGEITQEEAWDRWSDKMDLFEAKLMAQQATQRAEIASMSSHVEKTLTAHGIADDEQKAVAAEIKTLGFDLNDPSSYVGVSKDAMKNLINMALKSVRYSQRQPPGATKPKPKPKPPKVMSPSGDIATPVKVQKFKDFRDVSMSIKKELGIND